MGKLQKKRAMRRHNPIRVPDSHLPKGLASAEVSSSKKDEILPIIQKMESPDAMERKWACVAVSNLIQNDPSTRRLLQGKNVVGALITRLTDNEEEVAVEAIGSLRNLCIDGGYDICAEMYNKNILTPLRSFIPKISSTLAKFLESPTENIQKSICEFADNVITTLWCLSETSNKALNAINQMDLTPFLMSFLTSREHLPISTVTAAAQCLYVLTDDNQPVIDEIRSNATYTSCLLSIVQSIPTKNTANGQSLTLSVLACGTLRNVSPLPPSSVASFVNIDTDIVLPLLHPLISSTTLLEASNTALELLSHEASEPRIDKLSQQNIPTPDHKSPTDVQLGELENNLRTVQLALEILTGACATLPDPGPDPAPEESEEAANDDTTNIFDVEMDADDRQQTGASTPSPASFLSTLVQPLLTLIRPTSLSFPPFASPSPHPPTTSALSAIHVAATECLNNIFLSLSTSPNPTIVADREAGRRTWDEVWLALGVVGTEFGPGQERRQEIWENAVGVLWGVGKVWKGSLVPNPEQVKILIQFCDMTNDPRIRVKCIGTLECLAQHPDSIEVNGIISNYLLSILPTSTGPSPAGTEPLIQVVSALIDIYSDEDMPYDVNFRQGQMLVQLDSSIVGMRKAVKAIDRRKEGGNELRRRGDDVLENLVAFIQYRKDLGF